jgi:D-3-phosphoglycerate dehydrogenase
MGKATSGLRVLLLESVHPVAREALVGAGLSVELADGALSEQEIAERIRGVHVVGIRSKTQLTGAVLEAADELLAIGAFCIGTNQIALDAASEKGIAVFNAPFSNTRSVAELVIAEIVMLARGIGDRVREMHGGTWRKTAAGSHEVRGKTLGVIGYGHIGSQVGVLAEMFGMRVLFHDIVAKLPMGNTVPMATLDDVLAQSDFVTLHVPATPQTHLMIGKAQLARMKPGACLLNLSRGTVVDIEALAEALRSGHLGGAAVDVFPSEPRENVTDAFETELKGISNVILTPHIGGSTLEAQEAIGREVSATLLRFLEQGSTTGAVNFPGVELPKAPGATRISNVHENVPGVLRDVNRIVSDAQANVQAQVLATHGPLGYLLVDLDKPVGDEVCARMRELETTLRARAL